MSRSELPTLPAEQVTKHAEKILFLSENVEDAMNVLFNLGNVENGLAGLAEVCRFALTEIHTAAHAIRCDATQRATDSDEMEREGGWNEPHEAEPIVPVVVKKKVRS